MQQMLRAKCHWGLHIGMLKPTLSIRAYLIGILDGKTRYFDVKTNAKRKDGTKICRTNNKVPGIRIEIIYVDIDTKEVKEHTFDKNEWHKRYKIGRNEKGHYTGEILKR